MASSGGAVFVADRSLAYVLAPHAIKQSPTPTAVTGEPLAARPAPGAAQVPARVLLVGLGRTGLALGGALAAHRGARIAGLADPNTALRRFARGAGFAAPSFARLRTLLAKVEWDAAVVCGPRAQRAEWAAELAATGKPVLVLQPVAMSLAEATALAAAVPAGAATASGAASGPALHAGASILFHPIFRRARQLVRDGALGAPRGVRASIFVSRVFGPGVPPASGDVLDHVATDLLALLDGMFGAARAAEASVHRLYGERVDEVHGLLRLEGGLEVGVDCSWSVPGYPRASLVVEIEGERGRLIASDDALELERAADAGTDVMPTRWVAADFATDARFDLGGDETWLLADAFVRALKPPAPYDAVEALEFGRARRVLATIEAMRRSVAEQGARVEVAS